MFANGSESMPRCATWFEAEAERIALGASDANLQTIQASRISSPTGSVGISFDGVEKRFGSLVALKNISFEIAGGEFVALLGANGAGKTTLLRIAARLMRPTRGAVRFEGTLANSGDELRRNGFVAHSTMLYDDFSAEENLRLFAQLYGLEDINDRVTNALAACGLASRAGSTVRTFSRGMRQRLAIARAVLHEPRLLLLDEPAAGLDRQGLAWFGATLERLRGDGCTILMSTHARNESLDLATRAVFISGGQIDRDSGAGGSPGPLLAELRARQGAEA
jgi:heme ABC exporter ATP-binding subunit CcmA